MLSVLIEKNIDIITSNKTKTKGRSTRCRIKLYIEFIEDQDRGLPIILHIRLILSSREVQVHIGLPFVLTKKTVGSLPFK